LRDGKLINSTYDNLNRVTLKGITVPVHLIIDSPSAPDCLAAPPLARSPRLRDQRPQPAHHRRGTPLSYDGRGNLTQSGPTAYTYTAENRLATATPGAVAAVAKMGYDALGRLSHTNGSVFTYFDYDGTDLTMERANGVGAPIQRRYVHGPDSAGDDPLLWYEGAGTSDRRWLHADERGSIIGVSNSAGTMIALNAYDEYGIPAATNIGRFGYTGQTWLPEVGLTYYKARIYSPTLGRFMQTDPIGYGDGVNWYDYVDGDPVNRGDPTGLLFCESPAECVAVAEKVVKIIPIVETISFSGPAVATAVLATVFFASPAGSADEMAVIDRKRADEARTRTNETAGSRGKPQAPGERKQAGHPNKTDRPEKRTNPGDGTRRDNQSGKTVRPSPARPTPPAEPERVPRTRRQKRKANESDG
jgi:RHS repeat-associated protein